MISITVDLEWSPDKIIQDTINLLDQRDISATLFSTHNDGVSASNHERAIHPNFYNNNGEKSALEELSKLYPGSKGIRSHGLYIHSKLREHYPDSIAYESNYIRYLQNDINPHWMAGNIVQFPIYFMDDMWLRSRSCENNQQPLDRSTLLNGGGLKVFGFHPIHIYLNTSSIEEYNNQKQNYDSPEKIHDARTDRYGVRDLFKGILDDINRVGHTHETLHNLSRDFSNENSYDEAFTI
jgi:hypothetical protein